MHPTKEEYDALKNTYHNLDVRYGELRERYNSFEAETRYNLCGSVPFGRYLCRALFSESLLDRAGFLEVRKSWFSEMRLARDLLELIRFRGTNDVEPRIESLLQCAREALRVVDGSMGKLEELLGLLENDDYVERRSAHQACGDRFEEDKRHIRFGKMKEVWGLVDLYVSKGTPPLQAVHNAVRQSGGDFQHQSQRNESWRQRYRARGDSRRGEAEFSERDSQHYNREAFKESTNPSSDGPECHLEDTESSESSDDDAKGTGHRHQQYKGDKQRQKESRRAPFPNSERRDRRRHQDSKRREPRTHYEDTPPHPRNEPREYRSGSGHERAGSYPSRERGPDDRKHHHSPQARTRPDHGANQREGKYKEATRAPDSKTRDGQGHRERDKNHRAGDIKRERFEREAYRRDQEESPYGQSNDDSDSSDDNREESRRPHKAHKDNIDRMMEAHRRTRETFEKERRRRRGFPW